MRHRSLPALLLASATASLLSAASARAQTAPMPAAVIGRACAGKAGQPISRADIAEALLIETDISPRSVLSGRRDPAAGGSGEFSNAYDAALIDGLRAILREGPDSRRQSALNQAVRTLQQRLRVDPQGVTVERNGEERIELFGEVEPGWRIVCKAADPVPDIERPPVRAAALRDSRAAGGAVADRQPRAKGRRLRARLRAEPDPA